MPYYMVQAVNLMFARNHLVWKVGNRARCLVPVMMDKEKLAFGAWSARGSSPSAWKRDQTAASGISMAWVPGTGNLDTAGREWEPSEWVFVMVNWEMPPGTPGACVYLCVCVFVWVCGWVVGCGGGRLVFV